MGILSGNRLQENCEGHLWKYNYTGMVQEGGQQQKLLAAKLN
jgi:hypothetical protein